MQEMVNDFEYVYPSFDSPACCNQGIVEAEPRIFATCALSGISRVATEQPDVAAQMHKNLKISSSSHCLGRKVHLELFQR